MKNIFNRVMTHFLLSALLLAMGGAAWAEELDMGMLEEPPVEILMEAEEEENIETEEMLVFEEELFQTVKEKTEVFTEGELPEPEIVEDDSQTLDVGEINTFAAQELNTDVYVYAGINGNGNMDFFLMLPENVPGAAYTIEASDGQGGTATIENAGGERIIPVFADIRPDQIVYDMTLTIRHAGQEQFVSVWDYLAQVPNTYGLDVAALRPTKQPSMSGSIKDVSDWHAGLSFDSNDTAVLLCFRTSDAADLSIACTGHKVTSPVKENTGLWSVRIEGICTAELPADLLITAERGGETVNLSFSPLSCAASHWYENSPFILLCRAMASAAAAAK